MEPDITVFEISGRLQLGNLLQSVESAIRALMDGGARKLVIDLTGLNTIDSSGIGMLVSCSGQMEQRGGQMRAVGSHGDVDRVFKMVHMDRVLPLDPDLASACRSFSSRSTTT
jgi:anti-sigma B factor antagonist